MALNSCHSFRHRKKLLTIFAIWLAGITSGSIPLAYSRVISIPYGELTLHDCRENLPSAKFAQIYTIYIFVGTFGVPLVILIYVYSIIGYHVWRHVAPGNPHQSRDQNNGLTREKVIKILIFIVVLFFCSWAPLQIFNLLVEFSANFLTVHTAGSYSLFVYGYLASHLLAMAHSLVNPIAYCFISRNFWRNFCCLTRRFFVRLANCWHNREQGRHRWQHNNSIVLKRDRTSPRAANSGCHLFKQRPMIMVVAETEATPVAVPVQTADTPLEDFSARTNAQIQVRCLYQNATKLNTINL